MSLEDTASAGQSDRLAACVSAVERYLGEKLGSLQREARKSLLYAANETADLEEEERLISMVAQVAALAPVASETFRNAVLSRLKAPDEGHWDDPAVDAGAALMLVDTGKVDDWLRMREIMARHSDAARALEAGLQVHLTQVGGQSTKPDNAPVSVAGMCALFHASVRNLDAGHEARAALYNAFEETVVAGLGGLVEELLFILDAPDVGRTQSSASRSVPASPDDSRPDPGRSDEASLTKAKPEPEQHAANPPPGDEARVAEASLDPVRLLGAIAAVERQMLEVSSGRGLAALTELEARLTAALTPPGKRLSEARQRAVGAIAGLVHQAFAHPGVDPAVRARLWKLAPPLALLALQDDDQIDLVLQAARHDPVTGLLDRTAFRVRLEEALANSSPGKHGSAVCFLGVDGFQDIGQRLGQHVAGRLLRVLAEMMRRRAGASAHLARLRGAEFAVLIPARYHNSGWRFATQYLATVNKAKFAVAGHEMSMTVSIGVVESGHLLTTVSQVMQAADAAHKAAKDDGGGCARVHIPDGFD